MATEIPLKAEDIVLLQKRLAGELEQLKKEINAELERDDLSRYTSIIDEVRDRGDQSVADLYSDLELHLVERQVERLGDVERALQRIEDKAFGICEDCSLAISKPRLEADPTVRRCVSCQTRVENVPSAKDVTPSL